MILLQLDSYLDPEEYVPPIVDALTTVAIFVVVFAIIYFLGKYFVTRAVRAGLQRRGFEETLVGLAVSTVTVVTAVVAIALAATIAGFGVVLAAFATLAGALALAVGFAAQDLIANFVAGVFIIQDEPFEVGDWIEWDGNTAVVREIQLRVTKLDTFDNELVTVPNSALVNTAVTNPVANDTLRLSYDFGIGYGDDIEQARTAILEEGSKIEGVLEDPEPAAPVTDLGDSAVVLTGRVWIDPNEHGAAGVRAKFVEAVKQRLDEEGIDFPYPNTELSGDVRVENVGGGGATADD
jgi:small-conductance mechanosensitive channel